VLDIDETPLTNWPNLLADNFGFVAEGSCDVLPAGPCGFNQWILKSSAKPIEPARKLFDAAKANGVALIFITGRPDKQRDATILNLNHAGFEGWTELRTRPDRDDLLSVQVYKTAERRNGDFNIGHERSIACGVSTNGRKSTAIASSSMTNRRPLSRGEGRHRAAALRSRAVWIDTPRNRLFGTTDHFSAHRDRFRQANARASGSSINNVIESAAKRFRSLCSDAPEASRHKRQLAVKTVEPR
jgi:hypothetical protein